MFCNMVHRSDIILCGANCHIEHCQTIVKAETKHSELVILEYNTIPFFFKLKHILGALCWIAFNSTLSVRPPKEQSTQSYIS